MSSICSPGRYRMHDLISEHAQALAGRLDPDGDREVASKIRCK
jgi:hypothetical protein